MTREMEGYGEFSPAVNPLRVYKASFLMLKFRGLYLHSDMLSNGGGGGRGEGRGGGVHSQGKTLERTILFLSLGWHQTNAVI